MSGNPDLPKECGRPEMSLAKDVLPVPMMEKGLDSWAIDRRKAARGPVIYISTARNILV